MPVTFAPGHPGLRQQALIVQTSQGTFQFGLEGIGQAPQAVIVPGVITTVAGNGTAGYSGDSGAATGAELNQPYGIAMDVVGNLYIADYYNNRIRKVDAATGAITTVAGNGNQGYSGDGGPATGAELYYPDGVAVDAAGNLYIADAYNQRIRKVTAATGVITTVAGNGAAFDSGDGGPAISAGVYNPYAVAVDAAGNMYTRDSTGLASAK